MQRARVLVLALLLVTGCTTPDDEAADGEDTDGPDTYEDCDAASLSGERNNTTTHAARIQCDANVPGMNSQTLDCQQPDRAEMHAGANLTSGHVLVTVRDASDALVAEHRLETTPEEGQRLDVEPGEPGEWELETQRSDAFEGYFAVELSCPASA
jgi:hypothetical protein